MPPAARGLFSRKPPPGPPQKLFIIKQKFFGGSRGARLAFFKKAPLAAGGIGKKAILLYNKENGAEI